MSCVNDEQPKKVEFPIDFIEERIVICINNEHHSNIEFPIEVTEEGIVILC